ncbi:MAG: hypothetical protein JWP27_465 [Flaviaesturariibacter sp.]|nr:hypothetical protein [Flaviaesturariibacter sp.]
MNKLLCGAMALLLCLSVSAQEKWDLRRAVDYALANNISVKQADLQVRYAELNEKLARGAQLPNLNFGLNAGYNFGLNENPTTGTLQNVKNLSTTANLQSGATLFNWFSLKHNREAARINILAEQAQVTKAQNDIALNVAVSYLQILLAREQEKVVEVQVQQTISQLEVTRKRVAAGLLPELNAAELEAQLASDSTALITARGSSQQLLLQMKALLSLDAATPFDVVAPPVSLIPVEDLADLAPDRVFEMAVANLPQQKVNSLRLQAAAERVASARGQLYPVISAFGSLNTRYLHLRQPLYKQVLSGYQTTGLRADAGSGTFYAVQSPVYVAGDKTGTYYTTDPLGTQLSENFGQQLGVSVQVPIFNGYRARSAVSRARLDVRQLQLQDTLDRQTLKQDIYRAYNDAVTSIQKYNASRKSVAAAEKANEFAQKRFAANLLSTYDVINTQSRLVQARINMLSAQFDYVFRLKLLEFYKGQGLKL